MNAVGDGGASRFLRARVARVRRRSNILFQVLQSSIGHPDSGGESDPR